ncbi:MAG TPA: hypothetical protein V6C91_12670 [Coleofasciculaceae cyanobacterium]
MPLWNFHKALSKLSNQEGLITTSLLVLIGSINLIAAPPSLSQTDLNVQLRQALCSQNWGQALQILDRMKRAAGPDYAAQITMYQGQVESLARRNVNASRVIDKCSESTTPSEASTPSQVPPTNNPTPPPKPSGDFPSF